MLQYMFGRGFTEANPGEPQERSLVICSLLNEVICDIHDIFEPLHAGSCQFFVGQLHNLWIQEHSFLTCPK